MVLMLASRRYNYWHIPNIVNAIKVAYPGRQLLEIMQGFISMFQDSFLGGLYGEDLFAKLFPPDGQCDTCSYNTGRFCSMKACKNGPVLALCWQHRHIIMQDPENVSKKCSAEYREHEM